MKTLKCNIKVIEGGTFPSKKHNEDACFDLTARKIEKVNDQLYKVYLGVALQPQEGYRIALYPRSGISKTGWMLANSVGVGDNNYTGEYIAYFTSVTSHEPVHVGHDDQGNPVFMEGQPFPYKEGDRCIQMELVPYYQIKFNQVDELESTDRGGGGFGSTGVNNSPLGKLFEVTLGDSEHGIPIGTLITGTSSFRVGPAKGYGLFFDVMYFLDGVLYEKSIYEVECKLISAGNKNTTDEN